MTFDTFRKFVLGAGLAAFLILPTTGFAKTAAAASPAGLLPANDKALVQYSQLAAKYLSDCDDLASQPRPSGEQLKRCLTIAKELRDKFDSFIQRLEAARERLRGADKWSKETDDLFEKEGAKHVDATAATEVRRAGGFRAFYQNGISELKAAKGDLESEVKQLETRVPKGASTEGADSFKMVSYVSDAAHSAYSKASIGSKLKKVVIVVKNTVIILCCTFTDFCGHCVG